MIYSYEKIINEQDNIIEIKNQRIKLLENILIKHNVSFPKDSIIQTNSYINTKSNNVNNINTINSKDEKEIFNSDINQNLNITEEERIKSLSNNSNNSNNDDINYKELNSDLNSDDKIKIKCNNSSIGSNNKKEKNDKLKKEKIIEKEIIIDNGKKNNMNSLLINNTNESINTKKDFEIINNSLINHNNIGEITLERIEKYKDYNDEENFNVVISGTLKSKNNKQNNIIVKKEYKSSNIYLLFLQRCIRKQKNQKYQNENLIIIYFQ